MVYLIQQPDTRVECNDFNKKKKVVEREKLHCILKISTLAQKSKWMN